MAWLIKFDAAAKKDLATLDKPIAKRITAFLRERLAVLDDPRSIGEALKGQRLGEFWKYRVVTIGSSPASRMPRCAHRQP